jgi:hypothetical protein
MAGAAERAESSPVFYFDIDFHRGLSRKRKRKELDSRISQAQTTHYPIDDAKYDNLEKLTLMSL